MVRIWWGTELCDERPSTIVEPLRLAGYDVFLVVSMRNTTINGRAIDRMGQIPEILNFDLFATRFGRFQSRDTALTTGAWCPSHVVAGVDVGLVRPDGHASLKEHQDEMGNSTMDYSNALRL